MLRRFASVFNRKIVGTDAGVAESNVKDITGIIFDEGGKHSRFSYDKTLL